MMKANLLKTIDEMKKGEPMTNEELWETLGEDMSDVEKYYYVAVDPNTSKKSCLGFLKMLKKRAERIDHVCGRLIEEMEKEIHE